MKKFAFAVALLFMWISISFAQQNVNIDKKQRIEKYLKEMELAGFSGSVFVELSDGNIISHGYGYKNVELKERNTTETVFDIGSLTKQFTAAAILKLEMMGKLSTGNKITQYFNGVPADKSSITIHDLLRHQSGLTGEVGEDYEPISDEEFLENVMRSPLQFKAGTDFSYSNIGYSLLAIIIEKVSGQHYEPFLYDNLWKPAGMEFTGYSRPAFSTEQLAIGYTKNNTSWGRPTDKKWNGNVPYRHLLGNGGILSTTEDMFKWHKALMSDSILSKEAKMKLYHPVLRENENNDAIYAYGWDVSKTNRNTTRVWHNGTNNIFYADFIRFIDENTTIILLSNKTFIGTDQIGLEIVKMIFEKSYQPSIPKPDTESNQKFTKDIIDVVLTNGLEAAMTKYSSRPVNTDVLEYLLIRAGYNQLEENKFDQAIAIFTLNCSANPTSYNAFDSLGEAYMNRGDYVAAIKNYQKSLELDPSNQNAVEMIKKMK